jgi:hypothetical protein
MHGSTDPVVGGYCCATDLVNTPLGHRALTPLWTKNLVGGCQGRLGRRAVDLAGGGIPVAGEEERPVAEPGR